MLIAATAGETFTRSVIVIIGVAFVITAVSREPMHSLVRSKETWLRSLARRGHSSVESKALAWRALFGGVGLLLVTAGLAAWLSG